MNYESLIFDIDGTLWDSRALVAEGYNIQLKAEGLEHLFINAEILRPLFGKVMTEIADVILASIPAEERYDLMERCMNTENEYLHQNECRIGYPKVKETMAELAKKHRCSSSATANAAILSCASKSWAWGTTFPPICASATPAPARDRPSAP